MLPDGVRLRRLHGVNAVTSVHYSGCGEEDDGDDGDPLYPFLCPLRSSAGPNEYRPPPLVWHPSMTDAATLESSTDHHVFSSVFAPWHVDSGTRFSPGVRTTVTIGRVPFYDESLCISMYGILSPVRVFDDRSRRHDICPWCGFFLQNKEKNINN